MSSRLTNGTQRRRDKFQPSVVLPEPGVPEITPTNGLTNEVSHTSIAVWQPRTTPSGNPGRAQRSPHAESAWDPRRSLPWKRGWIDGNHDHVPMIRPTTIHPIGMGLP
jgi:hypothetical protein